MPAQVVSDPGNVLARNAMAAAVFGDLAAQPPGRRNLLLRRFTDPASRALFPPEDHEALARAHVAGLRAAHAARPGDRRAAELLAELFSPGEEFAVCWQRDEVALQRSGRKRVLRPVVGELEPECEVLATGGQDQLQLVHTAAAGSEAASRLELLRVVGAGAWGASGRPAGLPAVTLRLRRVRAHCP
ncbi:MmyB family transcriptional regulator [Kitasatospora aureofaciens]|uniref:MmyB family transcriptional regulator n=1 Tax=Kitasatospora aureofaciens TaxID=1894 RepID=UPI0036F47810